jgi:tetratricopeptide (TPR) repeat protein
MKRTRRTGIWPVVLAGSLALIVGLTAWVFMDPDDTFGLQYLVMGRAARHRQRQREDRREIQERIRVLEEQIDARGADASTWVKLAELRCKINRDAALQAVRRALQMEPNNRRARELEIIMLQELGRLEQVEQLVDKYTADFPGEVSIAFDVYLLYEGKASPVHERLAHQYFAAATAGHKVPRWFEYCTEQGYPLWPTDQVEARIAELEDQASAGKESVELLVELARLYRLVGEEDRALATIDRALAIDPRNQAASRTHIAILYNLRHYDELERAIDEHTALHPHDDSISFDAVSLYAGLYHAGRRLRVYWWMAGDYFGAIGPGKEMPRWSEYCRARGYPLWTDEQRDDVQNGTTE